MAFDGFINKSTVSELHSVLIGGKVSKIFQPNKDEIVLNIYSNSSKYNLDININSAFCCLHLSSNKKSNPITPNSFCMLLRKHLISAKITDIETNGFDRIVNINFETYNELNDLISKKLIIELMGKHSNIILVNNDNIIIDSLRHISADRNILPANPYALPTSTKLNINETSLENFKNTLANSNKNLIDSISNTFYGFSKVFTSYIVSTLNLNNENFSTNDIEIFFNYIQKLILNIDTLHFKCEYYFFNNKKDYVLISSENVSNLDVNTFLDTYYTFKEENDNFENYRKNILKVILNILKKYEKKLLNINNKLEECNKMDEYKLYGELITSNLYRFNNNINIDSISLENYYDNNNLIDIKLDKKYSLSMNAKIFFKKYNKLKNTLKIVSEQKIQTRKEIEYLESIIYSLNTSSTIQEIDEIYLEIQENILNKRDMNNKKIDKKNDSLSSYLVLNIDGYEVLVGKNNKQNDFITFRVANKEDIWFHVKDNSGSHVLLRKKTNIDVSEELLRKCASIAAYYSKCKASSKVEVQYTTIKFIKKPKNSRPGFVTFSKYNSIMVEPKRAT